MRTHIISTLRKLHPAVLAALAVMVVGAVGTAGAAGAGVVGTGQIKDKSIRSKDIRNGQVRSRDIKNGSVLRRDLSPALQERLDAMTLGGGGGTAGKDGVAGKDGAVGPQGKPGADGKNATFAATVSAGDTDCPAGGILVEDGDGTQRKVCHGQDGAAAEPTEWEALSLGTDWVHASNDYAAPEARVDASGVMQLRGMVRCTVSSNFCPTHVVTLPAGHKLEKPWYGPVSTYSSMVGTSGNVGRMRGSFRSLHVDQLAESGNIVSLDGVSLNVVPYTGCTSTEAAC